MDARHWIDGNWRDGSKRVSVINPSNGVTVGSIPLGSEQEIDDAVQAARRAVEKAGRSLSERVELLSRWRTELEPRIENLATLISAEMGTPITTARTVQAPIALWHIDQAIRMAQSFTWEERRGNGIIVHAPAGVVAAITPWNWPVHQIMCKVAFAIATGCSVVLKPASLAPLNANVLAEAAEAAAWPKGLLNVVHGSGATVGSALASHPDVRVVSFTGSTSAGIEVARAASRNISRTSLELGGKSANVLIGPIGDVAATADQALRAAFSNNGQSCDAPTRLLAPADQATEIENALALSCQSISVGSADDEATELGPVVDERQFTSIQSMIARAVAAGARVVEGGSGPALPGSLIVRPTVLADVRPDMEVFQEEVFGPVLTVTTYDDLDDAIKLANGTQYGLAAYITGGSQDQQRSVADQLHAGQVRLNYAFGSDVPFGGWKRSGFGREQGIEGLMEFTETRTIVGAL